jgi:hypothetical protein
MDREDIILCIANNNRTIDTSSGFIVLALEYEGEKIAIEIDGETYHNPNKISRNKYYDDLLKQNSLIYNNWKVYRWVYDPLKNQSEKVKDEMLTFFGDFPIFEMMEDYLPSTIISCYRYGQDSYGCIRCKVSR